MVHLCINYLLLYNKFLSNSAPQSNKKFYFPFSVCQESKITYRGDLYSRSLISCHARLDQTTASAVFSSEGLTEEQYTSNLNQVTFGRLLFFAGCCTEGLSSSLAAEQRHSLCLITQASPQSSFQHSTWFPSEQVIRDGKRAKTRSFYYLFSEGTNHKFCHILFLKVRISNSMQIYF